MSTKRLAHQVSATPSPRSRFDIGRVSEQEEATQSSAVEEQPDRSPAKTVDGMPRTTEILWNGASSLGFTLKRKRKTGAILVSKVKDADAASCAQLRIGSELKLVGGFPVQKLTLDEVKKVMLHAPKPVSLVFLNKDEVSSVVARARDNGSFVTDCSDDRGSFENEFDDPSLTMSMAPAMFPVPKESDELQHPSLHRSASAFASFAHTAPSGSSFATTAPAQSFSPTSSSGFTTYSNYYAKPTDSKSKKRKVSKLRVALDRMSQLLNRPVRQSALNIPAGKSIVV